MDVNSQLWAHVDKSGDCWIWTAGATSQGYGLMYFGKKERRPLAHRFSYELAFGPIPDGLVVDHECHNRDASCRGGKTCRHRRCVNPAHLSVKTNGENLAASHRHNSKKTHCPRNHEYTPETTRIHIRPNGTPGRSCRICAKENDWTPKRAEQQRQRRAKRKAQGNGTTSDKR